jgi:predicted metalloenzyme YecM
MGIETYNKVLQHLLQSKILIRSNNKNIKTGRLKLFNIKQYFIKLYIEQESKEIKVIELPYPYKIIYDEKVCTFNYMLTSLCNNQQDTMREINSIGVESPHKFFNSQVDIITLN